MSKFLEVTNLNVTFPTEDGDVHASNEVTYSVGLGETLAIVGESGSGKSVSNLAVMGLHNPTRTKITGSAILNLPEGPVDLISASTETVRRLRGKAMSMIFQDPMSALHPFFSICYRYRMYDAVELFSFFGVGKYLSREMRFI